MANMYINAMTALWNNAGTVYSAVKMNVTNSNSSETSKILRLQVAGVDKFSIDRVGHSVATGSLFLPLAGKIDWGGSPYPTTPPGGTPGDVTLVHSTNKLTFSGNSPNTNFSFDGSINFTNAVSGSSGIYTMTSVTDGTGYGPHIILDRVSPTPANADALGAIYFRGRNIETPTPEATDYAKITAHIDSVGTTGGVDEYGIMRLKVLVKGPTESTRIELNRDGTLFTGTTTMPKLRITSPGEAQFDSVDHGFQMGATTGLRIIMDENEFQSYNAAAPSSMYINGSTIGWNGAFILNTQPNAAPNYATSATYPVLTFDKVWTPAIIGYVGRVLGRGRDSANNVTDYADILFHATDINNVGNVEMGTMYLRTAINNTLTTRLTLNKDGATVAGVFDATRIELSSTADASPTTTAHAFQIGATTGANLRLDTSEILAVNNGVMATLYLQGGGIKIGPTGEITTNLSLVNAVESASASPYIRLQRDRLNPAAGDNIGEVIYSGKDSTQVDTNYVWHYARITSPTNGAETAEFHIDMVAAGASVNGIAILSNELNVGPNSSAHYIISRPSTSGSFEVAAGNASGSGANLLLHGSSKTSGPNNFYLRNGTTQIIIYDATAARVTISTDATINGGLSLGSITASSTSDLSKHLAVWGTTYGMNVTSAQLNIVSGGGWQFVNGTTVKASISSAGAVTCTNINTGACDISSTGAITGATTITCSSTLTAGGYVNAYGLRLTNTNDASATSTAHPLQIGPDNGANLILDTNEIWARSNGAASTLLFNGAASCSATGVLNAPAVTCSDLTVSNLFAFDSYLTSTDAAALLSTTGAGNVYLRPNGSASSAGELRVYSTGNVTVTSLTAAGNVACVTLLASGDVQAFSDETVKSDIREIDPAVAHRVMLALQGYHYKRTDLEDKDKDHSGLIAQHVIAAGAPELVGTDDATGKLTLNYNGLLAYVASAYHHQEDRLADLEDRLESAGL